QFALPPFVEQMVARGMMGAKAGAGFYQKRGDDILTLDQATLQYRAKQSPKLSSLEAAKTVEPAADRIRTLYEGKDKVGAFLRAPLGPTLEYAAKIAGDVAYSPEDVDKAMRWGFGWEIGPLATLTALSAPAATTPNLQPPTSNLQPPTPDLQPPTSNL